MRETLRRGICTSVTQSETCMNSLATTQKKIGWIALILMTLTLAAMPAAHDLWWRSGQAAPYLAWTFLAWIALLMLACWAVCYVCRGALQLLARIRARGVQ